LAWVHQNNKSSLKTEAVMARKSGFNVGLKAGRQVASPPLKSPVLVSKINPDRKPYESLETPRVQPNPSGGRGGKKEISRRIDEFHPRGAAGRREVRSPLGARKNPLPRRGNRTKNPK